MPSNMYAGAATWNPFCGCLHDCVYCRVSFQRQLKRWAKANCVKCYNYTPHEHPERLKRLPSSPIIFVCGDGDIAFCRTEFLQLIAERVKRHSEKCPSRTYYFQSKNWQLARRVVPFIQDVEGAVVLETLETNRDEGYEMISRAPPPKERHKAFLELIYPRNAITCEPLLDFDVDEFFRMITEAEPEFVWIGYNSKPKAVRLPEPSLEKTAELIRLLKASGIQVRGKNLRGLELVGGDVK